MVANSMTKQMTSSYRAVVAVGHKKTVTDQYSYLSQDNLKSTTQSLIDISPLI